MRGLLLLLFVCCSPGLLAAPPRKLLLVGCGPDDHKPGTHEYMGGMNLLKQLLGQVPGVEVTVVRAMDPWKDGPELIARSDGVCFFISEGARWLSQDPRRMEALKQLTRHRGGLSVLHWGMGTRDARHIEGFLSLFGACHGGPDRKYQVLETDVLLDRQHPSTRGIPERFRINEEFYYRLKVVKPDTGLKPIARAVIEGKEEMVGWAWQRPDGGRSFGYTGLHFHDNWRREEYRRLVAQGILWTMDVPIPEKGIDVRIPPEAFKPR